MGSVALKKLTISLKFPPTAWLWSFEEFILTVGKWKNADKKELFKIS